MQFGDDLIVKETSGSAGRAVVCEIPVDLPWTGPDDEPLPPSWATLTRADTEALRDHLSDLLERW